MQGVWDLFFFDAKHRVRRRYIERWHRLPVCPVVQWSFWRALIRSILAQMNVANNRSTPTANGTLSARRVRDIFD